MPAVGETKTINGVTGQWTGQTWMRVATQPPLPPVDRPAVSHPLLDMIPGLSDVLSLPSNLYKGATALPDVARGALNHPADTMKGFLSGASEAATPVRTGTLAALTGGLTLPAAIGAAGAQSAVEAVRGATGAPNAAKTFPQAAGRVAGAAAVPGLPAGVGAVAKTAARVMPRLVNEKTMGVGGALLGGYEGYKADGIPGAIAGATLGGGVGAKLRLPKSLQGLMGGAEAEAAIPMAKGYVGASEGVKPPRRSAPVPGSEYQEPKVREPYHVPPAAEEVIAPPNLETAPRVAGKAPTLEDSLNDMLQGLDTSAPSTKLPDTPSVRSIDRGNMVNSSPAPAAAKPNFREASRTPDYTQDPALMGVRDFGRKVNNLEMESRELPGQLRTKMADDLREPFDMSDIPESPDFPANHPARQPAPPPTDMPASLRGIDAPEPVAAPRELPRHDDKWGPGAVDTTGEQVQGAGRKGNLLYDAGTDTDYLREQLNLATDPAEREFLAKAIAQRYIISRRLNPAAGLGAQ